MMHRSEATEPYVKVTYEFYYQPNPKDYPSTWGFEEYITTDVKRFKERPDQYLPVNEDELQIKAEVIYPSKSIPPVGEVKDLITEESVSPTGMENVHSESDYLGLPWHYDNESSAIHDKEENTVVELVINEEIAQEIVKRFSK